MMRPAAEIAGAGRARTIGDIVTAAQMACLLEAGAPKPGNVSPGRPFADVRYEDFALSAAAIGEPLRTVVDQPLGSVIRCAIEATRVWTNANTNLGIVLLLAPLVKAASLARADTDGDPAELRLDLGRVLAATTVDDAKQVYAAIRAAAPGGLGAVTEQDVSDEPTVDLTAAMRLAAHRDTIAREYSTCFDVTFNTGTPALERALADRLDWSEAIVETFLTIVAAVADTHIARRAGATVATAVSRMASAVLEAGGTRTPRGRDMVIDMDRALRDPINLRNPGTSADLTAAAAFVVLLGRRWAPAEAVE